MTQSNRRNIDGETSRQNEGMVRKNDTPPRLKRRSTKVAKKEEIMGVLTDILRGERQEYHVKAVHKKGVYYDNEGRKCQRDDEVMESCECPAKISDLWRTAELLCRLAGYTEENEKLEELPPTVIIDGAEEL